jgi:hypothetical protein
VGPSFKVVSVVVSVAVQGVTCKGAQAPLEAFQNITIALLLFLLFECQ